MRVRQSDDICCQSSSDLQIIDVKEMDLYARIGSIRQQNEIFEVQFAHTCECSARLKDNIERVLQQINEGLPPINFGPPTSQKSRWQLIKEGLSLIGWFVLKKSPLNSEEKSYFRDPNDA
jgi:hypothetical protein